MFFQTICVLSEKRHHSNVKKCEITLSLFLRLDKTGVVSFTFLAGQRHGRSVLSFLFIKKQFFKNGVAWAKRKQSKINANGKLIAPGFPRALSCDNKITFTDKKYVVDFRFPVYFIYVLCTGVEHYTVRLSQATSLCLDYNSYRAV